MLTRWRADDRKRGQLGGCLSFYTYSSTISYIVILVPPSRQIREVDFGRPVEHQDLLYGPNGWSQRVLRLKLRLGTTHDPIPQTKTQRATYTFESECEGGRAIRAVGREG